MTNASASFDACVATAVNDDPTGWAEASAERKAVVTTECVQTLYTVDRNANAVVLPPRLLTDQRRELTDRLAQAASPTLRRHVWAFAEPEVRARVAAQVSLSDRFESEPHWSPYDAAQTLTNVLDDADESDLGVHRPRQAFLPRTWRDAQQVHLRLLSADVEQWVDIARLRRSGFGVVTFLRVAYHHLGQSLSNTLNADFTQTMSFDRRALELASVLYAKSRVNGLVNAPRAIARDFYGWQSHFAVELESTLCQYRRGAALLPFSTRPPLDRSVWFDGSAVRGAAGLNIDQLSERLTQCAPCQTPDCNGVDAAVDAAGDAAPALAATRLTLEARCRVLRESTDYPFGSPYQSLATVLLRLGPFHQVSTEGINDPGVLFERFRDLDSEWAASSAFPVAPYVLAAFHLAGSSNVQFFRDGPVVDQINEKLQAHFSGPLSDVRQYGEAVIWLTVYRAHRPAPDLSGPSAVITAAAAIDAEDLHAAPALLRTLHQAYHALLDREEKIIVGSSDQGVQALVAYFNRRLLREAPAPVDEAHSESFVQPSSPSNRYARAAQSAVALSRWLPDAARHYAFPESDTVNSAAEVWQGVFRFDADALMHWAALPLGDLSLPLGAVDIGEERLFDVGLPSHDAAGLAMLDGFSRLIGMPRRGAIPLGRVVIDGNPFGLLRKNLTSHAAAQRPNVVSDSPTSEAPATSTIVPISSTSSGVSSSASPGERRHFEPIRNVDTDFETAEGSHFASSAEQWRLVFLPDTNEVVPARYLGDVMVEMDWLRRRSGTAEDAFGATQAPQRSRQSRVPNTLGGASQTSLSTPPVLLDRPTVRDITAFFTSVTYTDRRSLGRCLTFRAAAPPRVQDFLRLESSVGPLAAAGERMLAGLQSLSEASPTLHFLLRRAIANQPGNCGVAPFELQMRSAARPLSDLVRRVIRMPEEPALDSASYVDCYGTSRFTPERAWLHEFLHTLTGMRDVAVNEQLDHRGPIVYLTDRILFEAGHNVEERVMYHPVLEAWSFERGEHFRRQIDAARLPSLIEMIAEDAYLDAVLLRYIPSPSHVLGVPLRERATVRQWQALLDDMRDPSIQYPRASFFNRFCDVWHIDVQSGLQRNLDYAGGFRDEAMQLYADDAYFKYLVERWMMTVQVLWSLQFKALPEDAEESNCIYIINHESHSLTINTGAVWYQSHEGPTPVEARRRWVATLYGLVTEARRSGETVDVRVDRGLNVYLENRYLRWSEGWAPRVSAQLAPSAKLLWRHTVKARRIADLENSVM